MVLRKLGLCILTLGLSACGTLPDVSMNVSGLNFLNRAPEKVTVADKEIVIAGPPGYCVDTSATRDSGNGAFVLLGSCASIANNSRASTPTNPSLLTASVSSVQNVAIASSIDRIQGFFTSPEGHAALARDGDANSIEIIKTRRVNGAFYMHARDSSANPIESLSSDYWRGLFDVHGRIVTVTVVGFKGRPLSEKVGMDTLNAFAARILNENPPTLAKVLESPET